MKTKEKKVKTAQRCPRCGGLHLTLCRLTNPNTRKKYYYKCNYCRFRAPERSMTRWGAKRAWNKLTNVLTVEEKVNG